jgi:tetratricopeptide (TPR) repeat protein
MALAKVKEKERNLSTAVEAFQKALQVYMPNNYPPDYAATQNNLGNAYMALAEVKDKDENLTRAVKAYEEALKVYTVGRYPSQFRKVTSQMEMAKKKMK